MDQEKRNKGKPELEDGYTKIADELLDALCGITLRPSEHQVFMSVVRQTYGWNKKEEFISIGQFAKATNLSRRTVIYALQNLEAKNMIKVKRAQSEGSARNLSNRVQIQKLYKKWVVQGKGINYSNLLAKQQDKYSKSRSGSAKNGGGSARNGILEVNSLHPLKDSSTRKTKEKTLSVETTNELNKYFEDLAKQEKLAPLKSVYNHWNDQNIIPHKKLTEKIKQKIRTHLKENTIEDITQAISNYKTVFTSPNHFFKYRWTLIDFLDRGLRKFLNEAKPLTNYLVDKDSKTEQPYKPDIIKCANCPNTWDYNTCKTHICPKCDHFNEQYYRKERQTRSDSANKLYGDLLSSEAREEAEEIDVAVSGLIKEVPPLTVLEGGKDNE